MKRRILGSIISGAAARPDHAALVLALALWLLGAMLELAPRPQAPFIQEDLRIGVPHARHSLALTVLRPRGAGPYGAIILNHGVPLEHDALEDESPALLFHTASAFVRRGYAVVMPQRRGFGLTGGELAENAGSCSAPDYRRGERAAAADVLAAYRFARKLPYVDPSRMILAGQSAGGVASLYAAAQAPEGLAAVLAFAAGRGGNPAREPGVPCAAQRLAEIFEEAGRTLRTPVLLHYAQNDLFFGPDTSRLWYGRLKAGGAPAEYVLQPPFGGDGHFVFGEEAGVRIWLPAVERFLRQHDIPFSLPAGRPA